MRGLLLQRVPAPASVIESEQDKEQQIVPNHAGPGRHQPQSQALGADPGAHDPDSPHTENVEEERRPGFSGALEHALHHDGDTVKGLGTGHHPQYRAAQRDVYSGGG